MFFLMMGDRFLFCISVYFDKTLLKKYLPHTFHTNRINSKREEEASVIGYAILVFFKVTQKSE
jgi:hypothetical protein